MFKKMWQYVFFIFNNEQYSDAIRFLNRFFCYFDSEQCHGDCFKKFIKLYSQPFEQTIVKKNKQSLLLIDDILPVDFLGSGYPRSRAIILMANKLGWDVTVYPMLVSGLNFSEVKSSFPDSVELVPEGNGESSLLAFLINLKKPFDCLIVSRTHNLMVLEKVLKKVPRAAVSNRFIYDSEAIFAEREIISKKLNGQAVSNNEALSLVRSEIALMSKGMDGVSCVSLRDTIIFKFFMKNTHKKVFPLQYPVNLRHNTPLFSSRNGLIFIARLKERSSPNSQGLIWFLSKVFPIIRKQNPEITLTIIGALPPNSKFKKVDGVNWLGAIDDLEPFYDGARLLIAPVFIASGIPLKIINAVANGVPVVATKRMGDLLDWPSSAMPSSDSEVDFAQEVLEIYQNQQLWETTLKTSQSLVEKQFNFERFEENLASLLS